MAAPKLGGREGSSMRLRLGLPAAVLSVVTAAAFRCSSNGPGADGGFDAGSPGDAGQTDSGQSDAGCPTPGPVKVLLLVQNSGEMCITDPPGYEGNAFCQSATAGYDGGPVAGRFKAIAALQSTDGGATASARLEPWNIIPADIPAQGFGPLTQLDAGLLAALQMQLTSVADMQGALERAAQIVETDIVATDAGDRLGTRYIAIILSDGLPTPRCSANDSLATYADAGNPALVWADTSAYCNTGSNGFCNPATGIDDAGLRCIPGFLDGGDLNQNYQLFSAVDRLVALKVQYNVGDVRVHSRLVFSSSAVAGCGSLCTDLFGGMSATDARSIGAWTLQQIATHGNGTFVDPGEPQNLTLGDIPLAPLTCP